ncbi:Receptor-like protein kinase THESEUS 1 [Trifolium repens]|nr:Receptor-like protein kinase THESEUS 1 [Trifolium repens]
MVMMKLVLVVVTVTTFLVNVSFALYTPHDNYLIACGSSKSINFQDRVFVPDSQHSSLVLKTGNSIVVASSNSSVVPSPIYQSARIFSEKGSYRFDVQQGRHWIRLYFYPLPNTSHNLTSASITVVSDDFVLLSNFTFRNYSGSYMFREYAVNVTSDSLTVTFIPSNGSVAFVNAIEVVSMPDDLFVDQALSLSPLAPFSGLSELAFETVYRLNIGGTLLTAENDTLGRTWENDQKYLHVNSSVTNVSASPSSIRYRPGVTAETAPNWVYATAEAMGDANVANSNFNITWVFDVDPSFSYFVRLHFCDIMSKAMNTLVFNVFINTDIAIGSLDLSSMTNDLAVPYFKDFVSNASSDNTLTVSVGPDTMADITNATMSGLEIMKISNALKSLDGLSSVKSLLPGSKSNMNKVGIIVGSAAGALVALAFVGLCVFLLARRNSKSPQEGGHSWLPLPLYGNSQTMTKMSTTSQKSGGTASFISSTNLGRFFTFQEILDATNKFDEKLLLGVGGFGRLQETSSALMEPEDNSTNHITGIQLTRLENFDNSVSMVDGSNSVTDEDAEDAATSAVFSQLVNPRGR